MVDLLRTLLKLIQLFENCNGDVNIVFLKLLETFVVVEDYVRIENEILLVRFFVFYSNSLSLLLPS